MSFSYEYQYTNDTLTFVTFDEPREMHEESASPQKDDDHETPNTKHPQDKPSGDERRARS